MAYLLYFWQILCMENFIKRSMSPRYSHHKIWTYFKLTKTEFSQNVRFSCLWAIDSLLREYVNIGGSNEWLTSSYSHRESIDFQLTLLTGFIFVHMHLTNQIKWNSYRIVFPIKNSTQRLVMLVEMLTQFIRTLTDMPEMWAECESIWKIKSIKIIHFKNAGTICSVNLSRIEYRLKSELRHVLTTVAEVSGWNWKQ